MKNANLKVKLAAIARDEAAYLPEWIFHHLEFGFDEIEIYINNTTDNSFDILRNIAKNYPVIATDANELYQSSNKNFQSSAYQEIAKKALDDGFTHLMLLDIDEFWTPADFNTSIHDAIAKFNYPQVINFNWLIHCDEKEFSPCYKPKLKVKTNPHVKTIFQLDAPWKKIDIHNVIGKKLTYTRGNGSTFDYSNSKHCGIADRKCLDHDYFVIHRMYRSQMEYISLLGRGRANTKTLTIKSNRQGYYEPAIKYEVLGFSSILLDAYYSKFNAFIELCCLPELIIKSQGFVRERFKMVIGWLDNSNKDNSRLLYRLLSKVDLPEIVEVKKELSKQISLQNLSPDSIAKHLWYYLLFTAIAKVLHCVKLKDLSKKIAFKGTTNLLDANTTVVFDAFKYALKKASCGGDMNIDIIDNASDSFSGFKKEKVNARRDEKLDSRISRSWFCIYLLSTSKLYKKPSKLQYYSCLSMKSRAINNMNLLVDVIDSALGFIKYEKHRYADIFRDMAVFFYERGELFLACGFIDKAFFYRPKGPIIIILHKQFHEGIQLTTDD